VREEKVFADLLYLIHNIIYGGDWKVFGIGEDNLEMLLKGFDEGSMVLILGHPGAGKTTFAAKILYRNCRSGGVKCVYVSLAEDRDKFLRYMGRFGIDLDTLERKGIFEFIHMPTFAGKDLVESVTSVLSAKIVSEGFRVAVVDSVTPLLNALTTDEARSYLHATLYNLVRSSQGLLILVADLPYGKETVDLRGLEFIADAVFVFKTRVERGLITRFMEVRKFRGRRIPIVEIPFTIAEDEGVKIILPPPLEEIPVLTEKPAMKSPCSELLWGPMPRGTYIGVVGKDAPVFYTTFKVLLDLALKSNAYLALLSFRMPSSEMKRLVHHIAQSLGQDIKSVEELIKFEQGVNPSIYSCYEVMGILRQVIDRDPDILLLHGTEMLYLYHPSRYIDRGLRDLALYARRKGTSIVEFVSGLFSKKQLARYSMIHLINLDEHSKVVHTVYRHVPIIVNGKIVGAEPRRIYEEELLKCIKQM